MESPQMTEMPTKSDPRYMTDRELMQAYQATDGDTEDQQVNELVEEIERRGLNV
jgi:hypothetical protein